MKRKVLKKAKLLTTRIPLKDTVLIIDEISKDISGTGMDANVPGDSGFQGMNLRH